MGKSTVVFDTDNIVVDGRVPWVDSKGNPAQPEKVAFNDSLARLEKLTDHTDSVEHELELSYKENARLRQLLKRCIPHLKRVRELDSETEIVEIGLDDHGFVEVAEHMDIGGFMEAGDE